MNKNHNSIDLIPNKYKKNIYTEKNPLIFNLCLFSCFFTVLICYLCYKYKEKNKLNYYKNIELIIAFIVVIIFIIYIIT